LPVLVKTWEVAKFCTNRADTTGIPWSWEYNAFLWQSIPFLQVAVNKTEVLPRETSWKVTGERLGKPTKAVLLVSK